MNEIKKVGVFLARMQPLHNAHLFMINEALEENDKVLVVLGSENKVGTLRNPFDVSLREELLRKCFNDTQNERIKIVTLPDWSMETDLDDEKTWGRYFYYNVVSKIGQKRFTLYYYDEPKILEGWFTDTEVYKYITYRTFERQSVLGGISSTKIRQALLDENIDYVKEYCPKPVVDKFDYLSSYYKNVKENPKDDFSME